MGGWNHLPATWTYDGASLVITWPGRDLSKAPAVERNVLSPDGNTFEGMGNAGVPIRAVKVSAD